jgi:anti-sigma B factor antagonist
LDRPTSQSAVAIIRLEGHIRMGEATDDLRAQVEEYIAQGNPRILIDMGKVKSLDSTGIGVLVRSLTLAKQKTGTVKLFNLPTSAQEVLRVTGVLRLFETFPDESTAMNSFVG